MDMLIVDDVIYFLTMASENLFGIERAYKKICRAKLEVIKQLFIDANNICQGYRFAPAKWKTIITCLNNIFSDFSIETISIAFDFVGGKGRFATELRPCSAT